MKLKQFGITFLSVSIAAFSGMKAAEAASFSVIADGLNNPRGLTFGTDGSLYVTEAGTGGSGACVLFPSGASSSPFEIQAVPTNIAKGPDGAYYISQLTGFPFPEGAAKIYRVGADGQPTVYTDGFTQLTDLDFDNEGNLYALQYANQSLWKGNLDGSVIKIGRDRTRTTILSGNGLESATALTIGADNAIYVTNRGDRSGLGQVIKIENSKSVPESTSTFSLLAFLGTLSLTLLHKGKAKGLSN
ncbi:MAG: ScyD/ScyE family protein [Nostoc sp. JL31]|uniref:ScyD/ScyE family protein n=1 Tax=Nostoc sp. JL31 TaxID=2815395 RepID=UPI0025E3BB74|nr:ScyD/ScyE family protein [Nostoc sp. JL31]MBN3891561.1 ScyD/ScyE family protein [Nostoc sp. JL31]